MTNKDLQETSFGMVWADLGCLPPRDVPLLFPWICAPRLRASLRGPALDESYRGLVNAAALGRIYPHC